MTLRRLDIRQAPPRPWKNGAGITRELAVAPAGAGLDDFAWRISCAQVDAGGPFSRFAGVDRSLAVLEGHGLRLRLAGREHRLGACQPPLAFAGEDEASAELLDGPVGDLNVMTRRDAWRHRLQHLHLCGTQRPELIADLLFIYCRHGDLQLRWPERTLEIGPGQGLLLEDEPPPEALHSASGACLYIACLQRLA
ncbi:HutD family protein [Pseudomonas sp. CAU 1711]|uniref:HutD/Ves family protein n=1 Tax=Pseudomonas sp. CAU 1711 TaxID=3140356 RepID=UPI003261B5D8